MKLETADHPTAPKLDAFAAGDEDASVADHLRACDACRAYVDDLREQANTFRASIDPRAFAEKIRERSESAGVAIAKRSRSGVILGISASTLAMAAAIFLWLRVASPTPQSQIASNTSEASHFKGSMSVRVIRDRKGHQENFTGPFVVHAGDRIRIEVGIDHASSVTAGFLADDGTWTPILVPTELEAGTSYSDLAARFDDAPVHASLIVGTPEAVDRARRSHTFNDVIAWRVTSEPGP
jgi:hypothetical protein